MKRLLLVLGMHRSGTSCLTGLLGESGVWLGPVEKGSPHNRKGNNENRRVMNVNKAVLRDAGHSWHEPPEGDAPWTAEHIEQANAILEEVLSDGRTTAMKDPRTIYTGEGWIRLASRAGAAVSMVGTFRHPDAVVRSLQARDPDFGAEKALALWAKYNRRLLAFHDERSFPIVNFDLDSGAYLATVREAFDSLGLTAPPEFRFFEPGLRTNQPAPVDLEAASLYEELARRAVQEP